MSKQKKTRGKINFSLPIFVSDTSSTTGGGLGGVTSASSGLLLEYRRQGESVWTLVTPVAGKTLGGFLSGGIVADGSLAGAYEVDFPNAAYASAAGVEWVAIRVRGVTNMLPVLIEIELDAVDYQDAVRFGLTAMPNVASGTAGALVTSGNGTAQIATSAGLVTLAGVTHAGAVIPTVTSVTNAIALPAIPTDWITSNGIATDAIGANEISAAAVTKIQNGLLASASYVAPDNSTIATIDTTVGLIVGRTNLIPSEPASRTNITTATGVTVSAIGANVITAASVAADAATEIATAVAATQILSRLDSMVESNGGGQFRFDTIALSLAPAGGGGGGGTVNITVEDSSITIG